MIQRAGRSRLIAILATPVMIRGTHCIPNDPKVRLIVMAIQAPGRSDDG
jgi:hypothetical protein